MKNVFNPVTEPIDQEILMMEKHPNKIEKELFCKYNVKRGLREQNGEGVLAGITNISTIKSYEKTCLGMTPCEGKLYYRGIDIEEIVKGFTDDKRFGFEETVHLLLFGTLPTVCQLAQMQCLLERYRDLPISFIRTMIDKGGSKDIMNELAVNVLLLHASDPFANKITVANVFYQSLHLIALLPVLSVYEYQIYRFYHKQDSLIIRPPKRKISTAEQILYLLRKDNKYSELEVKILDLLLVLHAEHGGGNNSSFTVHVLSSSGTDTYAALSAAIGALKGAKHGGANVKVMEMMEEVKKKVTDWENQDEIRAYLYKILNKQAFDQSGLIYGIGHAVYTISDPRSKIISNYVEMLSKEKGKEDEFRLYQSVERIAREIIVKEKKSAKFLSANIDFYSGFIYRMLGLPYELFTPLFASARIVGWSAHRIEELINGEKLIRPKYKGVAEKQKYTPLNMR